jgi:GTP cyclohydrolase IA
MGVGVGIEFLTTSEELDARENFRRIVVNSTQALITAMRDYGNIKREDENFIETPARVAKAYVEILDGIFDGDKEVGEILKKTFPSKSLDGQMITVGPVDVWSLCPHHLLPVHMKVWVAYIPKDRVLGLSKLARLAELQAKKPAMQEDTTTDIAEALWAHLAPKGAGCFIRGRHLCMEMRGVKKAATTTTTAIRGIFLEDDVKNEFLNSVRSDCGNVDL